MEPLGAGARPFALRLCQGVLQMMKTVVASEGADDVDFPSRDAY